MQGGSEEPYPRHQQQQQRQEQQVVEAAAEGLVVVDYSRLCDSSCELASAIESAFGPQGLGVIAIDNVPEYVEYRSRLLPLAERLAALPEDARSRLEDPASRFSFGWSVGKEAVQDGRTDSLKASFYANPVLDVPTTDADLIARYPSYCRPNLWPSQDLPELETDFKALGGLVVRVGMQLVRHCDAYVAFRNKSARGGRLERALERSKAHKARLLLYLPTKAHSTAAGVEGEAAALAGGAAGSSSAAAAPAPSAEAAAAEAVSPPEAEATTGAGGAEAAAGEPSTVSEATAAAAAAAAAAGESAEVRGKHAAGAGATEGNGGGTSTWPLWCGWHLDHGSLTGLTRAQFRREGKEVRAPDPRCGLYVRRRDGQVVKVSIPERCIAFQMGQAMSIQSGGLLCATPHCVRAAEGDGAADVTRATFAVFMQPMWDEVLDIPSGTGIPNPESESTFGPWKQGMDFGTFSELTIAQYY